MAACGVCIVAPRSFINAATVRVMVFGCLRARADDMGTHEALVRVLVPYLYSRRVLAATFPK